MTVVVSGILNLKNQTHTRPRTHTTRHTTYLTFVIVVVIITIIIMTIIITFIILYLDLCQVADTSIISIYIYCISIEPSFLDTTHRLLSRRSNLLLFWSVLKCPTKNLVSIHFCNLYFSFFYPIEVFFLSCEHILFFFQRFKSLNYFFIPLFLRETSLAITIRHLQSDKVSLVFSLSPNSFCHTNFVFLMNAHFAILCFLFSCTHII